MSVVNLKKKLPLSDGNLANLRESGLSDETIRASEIRDIPPTGWESTGAAQPSGYVIPYDETFSRFRLFYDEVVIAKLAKKKRPPKYTQPSGSPCRLYIPPTLNRAALTDQKQLLVITEGEKKALKAVQEDIVCVGVGGWFNVGTGELIPDFDNIKLDGREVVLVPDNDWDDPEKNIALGVRRLAALLEARGAIVTVRPIPPGPLKGLDDYLCKHSVEDFWALPVVELGIMLDPADPYPGALKYLAEVHTADGIKTLHFWQDSFYKWDGAAYRALGAADMKESIYAFLNDAVCQDGVTPYAPNQRKVADFMDALKAAANLSSDFTPPCWLGTGTAARPPAHEVLCTANGLLHLPTEELHPHTPEFFTLNALPYAADFKAGAPRAWLKFLASIWPDDSNP